MNFPLASPNPTNLRIDLVRELLSTVAFVTSNEEELQAAIAQRLNAHRVAFIREAHLGAAGRIDFLVGDVGLEIKVDGAPGAVRDQLRRYAESGRINYLFLATSRRRLGAHMPARFGPVLVEVVNLRAAL